MIKTLTLTAAMTLSLSAPALAFGPANIIGVRSAYEAVSNAAQRNGVPQRLAHAVIKVESGHNCHARNRSGAAGLGQLMPATARSLGVRNPMSCEQNAEGAMRYLGQFYRQSGGNACAAATAYNRGSLGGCSAYGRKVLNHM